MSFVAIRPEPLPGICRISKSGVATVGAEDFGQKGVNSVAAADRVDFVPVLETVIVEAEEHNEPGLEGRLRSGLVEGRKK